MTALNDRRLWLAHLHECAQCPWNLCDKGWELAAAVQETLTPGESWEGVWAPREREEEILARSIYRLLGGADGDVPTADG